jgi:lipoprotein-releasing system permease protein
LLSLDTFFVVGFSLPTDTEEQLNSKTMKRLSMKKSFVYFRVDKNRVLAHEYFIAKKIFLKENEGKKVSQPIVRISMISIALAIVINLLTVAVVIGFQKEVREKVSGFSSHALIFGAGEGSIYECDPIRKNQAFFAEIKNDPAIAQIQRVAYKPILLQSEKNETKIRTRNGKDSTFSQQNIQGAVLKGVDDTFDWTFFKENLVDGRLPQLKKDEISTEILISKRIARDLQFKVGDSVRAYFVKNQPMKRFFRVSGIYHTGLEEFDKKMIVGDLRQVQVVNDWGIQASIELIDTVSGGYLVLKANVLGGNGYYEYDWGKGFGQTIGIKICPSFDTTFRLIARNYEPVSNGDVSRTEMTDTAYIEIKVKGIGSTPCNFSEERDGTLKRFYSDNTGYRFSLKTPEKEIFFVKKDGKGSASSYIAGFEVNFKNWNDLDKEVKNLRKKLTFIPTENGELLQVSGIKENQQEIFLWLDFLDLNVYIILVLMILIGIINVGAALLVLILVKTHFIGMMKAMGSLNWQIRKIFLLQAFFIIGKGMIWGNIIGLGICFIQWKFGLLSLNPEVYYLDKVPITIGLFEILLLNAVTLLICLAAMIIPSAFISRVLPTKAIKFQ